MDISASIFAANLLNLEKDLNRVLGKINSLHFDVMDGYFVNNFALSPCLYKLLSDWPNLPIDVHLMTNSPLNHIDLFPNARTIFVHPENQTDTIHALKYIKEKGSKAGLALNPETPLDMYMDELEIADEILIMAVNPGLSGQKLLYPMLDKINQASISFTNKTISADGGINFSNLSQIKADKVVMGSGLFALKENIK